MANADVVTPPTSHDSSVGLAKIVVTAERREENLQNVPITVSVQTLAKANVTTALDLNKVTP
jgi:outer membrane cobalamin receptor